MHSDSEEEKQNEISMMLEASEDVEKSNPPCQKNNASQYHSTQKAQNKTLRKFFPVV